ncbi:faeC [Symbiodinium sp. KB8]|nr:faeC [Symbiodinium sp. KB8]
MICLIWFSGGDQYFVLQLSVGGICSNSSDLALEEVRAFSHQIYMSWHGAAMPEWGSGHADSRRSSWCSASLEGRGARSIVATLYAQQEKLHDLELKLRQLQATPSAAAEQPRNRGMLGAHENLAQVAAPNIEIVIPDFVDCSGLYKKWYGHEVLFWQPFGMLHTGIEDYPPGAASFYHSCHFQERTEYCLYGHVAALTYLAKYTTEEHVSQDFARHAMRLLHWNLCLDFLESSTWAAWGLSILTLWDMVQNFAYPQVSLLHQYLDWGPGTAPNSQSPSESQGSSGFWILELGTHRALSNEPVSMLKHVLSNYDVVHENPIKPYQGRAEAFVHPFPRQDSVPYSFPVFEDMDQSRRGFHEWVQGSLFNKVEIRKASLLLCTNPIYYCNFFAGLNKTILGYFGLPLLYMVPESSWSSWIDEFIDMASMPTSFFVSNNRLHSEQLAWQSGVRLHVVQPVANYLKETYSPQRLGDILVPEPREACVLHCLIRAFKPASYPFNFFSKADTDRTIRTFVTFRAIVLFPHDFALMTFYEFYAMGVPLFMPSHLSKYLFPFSASVPLLDWVPKRIAMQGGRPPYSPLSMTTSAALQFWSSFIDFFAFPGIQHFDSIASLLVMLPSSDFESASRRMRDNREARVESGAPFWSGGGGVASFLEDVARRLDAVSDRLQAMLVHSTGAFDCPKQTSASAQSVDAEVHSSSGVPLVMSFHGTYESPWFHEREVGYMDVLSRHGWLGILPWGTRLESPSAMGGVTECCSRWCDSEECCMKGGFVSAKIEACGWWVPERDVTLVDTIWNWVEEHTCVDRTKVFAAGFSAGGGFNWHLACHRSQYFRGVAPIEPVMFLEEICSEPSARPVSILTYGGSQDVKINLEKIARMTGERAEECGCQGKVAQQLSATVNCTTWSQCSGGHLFEFCVVDGMSHNIPGHLKPDQTTFIRAGSDVDWTKRTFERLSLLVQPGQLLFYGQPTAEELDYHSARWPPPKLTALPVSQPRSAVRQREAAEEMCREVDRGFQDFVGISREPPALRHTGLGSAPSWPEKAEDAWRERQWIEPVAATQVHRPALEAGAKEANPSPFPQANQRIKAVPELPVAENIDRDVFLAMGCKAPQPRDVALPYDRQMPAPLGAGPLTATALPERCAGTQPQLSEPKEFGVGVFQAPARHVQQTTSPLLPKRSDVPQMAIRGCEWLEPVTGAAAEPVQQSTAPAPHLPGRLPGQALLGEEPREFDPDVLWAKYAQQVVVDGRAFRLTDGAASMSQDEEGFCGVREAQGAYSEPDHDKLDAELLKEEGNQLLKADEPELAIERYEGALEVLGRVGGGANELLVSDDHFHFLTMHPP